MKLLLILMATFASLIVQAQVSKVTLPIPTAADYEGGRVLCEQKYASFVSQENGFYTSVPVDYKNKNSETTDVYSFFYGGYDPQKETILYFTGGPGLTGHWGLFSGDMPYNTLIIDNRGIACSRPATVETYLNPLFYSSEFVARDAKIVIEKLGLKKVTAYGISYGTATATIFASLYPDATRALILEGTLVSGHGELFEATHRRKLVQKMIDQLPKDIKAKMERVHAQYSVPITWLSRTARNMMMSDEGVDHLKTELLSFADEDVFLQRVADYKDLYAVMPVVPNPLFSSNDLPYYMISCQELSLAKAGTSTEDAYVNGKLVATEDATSFETCKKLNAVTDHTYDAKKYLVNVPVTYFQGSDDGATPAPGAFLHYKSVPQKFKQLMVLVRGGHNPNLSRIGMDNELQKEVFGYAFNGTAIPTALLKQVQAQDDLKWVYTSK